MCYRKGALIRASGAERSGSQNLQAVLQTSKQKPRLTFLHSFCLRRRCSPTRSGWRATRSPRRVSCGLFAFRMRNGSIGLLRFWCLQRSAAAEPNPALLTPGTGLCPGGGGRGSGQWGCAGAVFCCYRRMWQSGCCTRKRFSCCCTAQTLKRVTFPPQASSLVRKLKTT